MSKMNRRDFLKLSSAAGAATLVGGFGIRSARAASARVVVIGGGFGGASCAKYLRRADATLSVTLIEPNTRFVTCPFSNYVLGGIRTMDSITHTYDALRDKHGVDVVHDTVTAIDAAGRKSRSRAARRSATTGWSSRRASTSNGTRSRATTSRLPSGCRTRGRPARKRCCSDGSSRRCRMAACSSWLRRPIRSAARPDHTSAPAWWRTTSSATSRNPRS